MQSLSNISYSPLPFTLYNERRRFPSLKSPPGPSTHASSCLLRSTANSSFLPRFDPLSNWKEKMMRKKPRGFGTVCYSMPLTPRSLQWISTVSTAVLMLARGTAIQKSFLVPLFVLQAPLSIISWIKGEYGIWFAFLALLVRLFFYIPGELELPFIALLLVIVAPFQAMNLRGTQAGVILSLVIAGYLAFQHFSRTGSLKNAFDQGSIVATLAIICISIVPCLLLI
ncbi:cold-regulated 413 inner membrane protein 1, chloroplastic-like isoform X2 [Diospyros lotus]|uniref:cold-regulated 413 inner membrane protein 1, chloroplastic-like isoform X2 n=1 Tax=Diospyros lotus TaxID=55363 RepID=UPI0022594FE2|nr:cold-regulated 413 inner membrane protein 1, chloroplastic-like isoform X2 [Diospyros lotus]